MGVKNFETGTLEIETKAADVKHNTQMVMLFCFVLFCLSDKKEQQFFRWDIFLLLLHIENLLRSSYVKDTMEHGFMSPDLQKCHKA